jgi:hypothetical protein
MIGEMGARVSAQCVMRIDSEMSEGDVTRIEGGASTVFLQLRQLAKWAIRLQYHIFPGAGALWDEPEYVVSQLREAANKLRASGVDETSVRVAIGTAFLEDFGTRELLARYHEIEALRDIAEPYPDGEKAADAS